MRIVAGRWRGRALVAPPAAITRPTAARAREALFSMLASRLGSFDGLAVLDLFAGTGALGLEALSRGAARATFVEAYPAPLAALRANIAALEADAVVVARRVEAAGAMGAHDLVFIDPPYHMGLAAAALAWGVAGGWFAPGAWIAVETARDEALAGWEAVADRSHGKARLRLLHAGGAGTC